MATIVLEYRGDSLRLGDGVTDVGRSTDCDLSIADPSVSRRHVRFTKSRGNVLVEDLGSTNGTLINGEPAVGICPVGPGDIVTVGGRQLTVKWIEGESLNLFDGNTAVRAERPRNPSPQGNSSTQIIALEHCPVCGEAAVARGTCTSCGTSRMRATGAQRRKHERHEITLPLVYSSASLEVNAKTRDLSLGGVFVTTDYLDPPGTSCRLSLLNGLFEIGGKVARVAAQKSSGEVGLGVQFTDVSVQAKDWLAKLLGSGEATTTPV